MYREGAWVLRIRFLEWEHERSFSRDPSTSHWNTDTGPGHVLLHVAELHLDLSDTRSL
jgi:hypothetical protein